MFRYEPTNPRKSRLKNMSYPDSYQRKKCETLRKVRSFLIAHPGSTNEEIQAACDGGPMALQERGLAYWKRNAEGKAVWFAKPGLAYPERAAGAEVK